MNWFILTIISATTSSLTKILQKLFLDKKGANPMTFSFVFQLIIAFIFLLYCLITKTLYIPKLSHIVTNLILMAMFYGLGNICIFYAFKLTEASESAIIFSSSSLWAVLSAVIFLKESLDMIKIMGIILVLSGLIAVNYAKTSWKVNRGHFFAIIAALCFGLGFTNDMFVIREFKSVASYSILAFAFPGLLTIFFSPKLIFDIPYFFKPNKLIGILLPAIIYSISAFTIYNAYKLGGQASIISSISATSTIMTVIISYFFLKERDRIPNKILGTILTFIGVLLLI